MAKSRPKAALSIGSQEQKRPTRPPGMAYRMRPRELLLKRHARGVISIIRAGQGTDTTGITVRSGRVDFPETRHALFKFPETAQRGQLSRLVDAVGEHTIHLLRVSFTVHVDYHIEGNDIRALQV